MNVVKARVIKLATHDGLMEFNDDVKVGNIYNIDLDSKQKVWGINVAKKKAWIREVVDDVDNGGVLPIELLSICSEDQDFNETCYNFKCDSYTTTTERRCTHLNPVEKCTGYVSVDKFISSNVCPGFKGCKHRLFDSTKVDCHICRQDALDAMEAIEKGP